MSRWEHTIALALALGFLWTQLASPDQFDTGTAAARCRDDAGRFVACADEVSEPAVTPIVDPLPSGPAPGYEPKADAISVRFAAGVMAGKAADVDVRPLPAASIHVDSPLTSLSNGPRLNVDVSLTGLPKDGVSLESPGSVKAFDGSAGLVQPLGSVLQFNLYARLGVASRLASDTADRDRLPGYASIGLDFHTANGDHYLQIGGGPDQRLSGSWSPSIHVTGGVKVGERAGAKLWLVGSIIRALDLAAYGYPTPSRDWWTVGVQVGR